MTRHTRNSKKLFSTLDELHEQVEVIMHDAIVFRKKNRLDIVEESSKEVARLAIEMQEIVKAMRRK